MTIQQIITLMSTKPADILGIEKGRLRIGDDGDLVVFDPDEVWIVDPEKFRSKGHNTPFAGKALKGKVKSTIIAGKIVYKGE